MQDYGKRLKKARLAKSMTQVEVAELLGITQSNYQRLERGTLDPKMSTIYNLCSTLNVSSDWLIGLREGIEP